MDLRYLTVRNELNTNLSDLIETILPNTKNRLHSNYEMQPVLLYPKYYFTKVS